MIPTRPQPPPPPGPQEQEPREEIGALEEVTAGRPGGTRPWIVAGVAVAALGVAAGLYLLLARDSHVQRATDLLAIDEVDGAATELKLAAKKGNAQGKVLLTYVLARKGHELGELFGSVPLLRTAAREDLARVASPEWFGKVDEAVKRMRRRYYEKGLDTGSAQELHGLVVGAARHCLKECRDTVEREAAAFAVAADGDEAGIAMLVDRLKASDTARAEGFLRALGARSRKQLEPVADDPAHLGRAAALRILAFVGIQSEAARFFEAHSALRGLAREDLPANLRGPESASLFQPFGLELTRTAVSQGFVADESPKTRLRAVWTLLDDAGKSGILVLHGFDAQREAIRVAVSVLRDGRYAPARLTRAGQPADGILEGSGPVVRVRGTAAGLVELSRLELAPVDQERLVEQGSLKVGDRAAVRGTAHRGMVAGTGSYGLLRVRFSEPVDGAMELELPPSALQGVERVQVTMPRYRTFRGRLTGPDQATIDLDSESALAAELPAGPVQ